MSCLGCKVVVGDVQPRTAVHPGTPCSEVVAALFAGKVEAVSVRHGELVARDMEVPAQFSLVTTHRRYEKLAYL